jgi:hypothetical protein
MIFPWTLVALALPIRRRSSLLFSPSQIHSGYGCAQKLGNKNGGARKIPIDHNLS